MMILKIIFTEMLKDSYSHNLYSVFYHMSSTPIKKDWKEVKCVQVVLVLEFGTQLYSVLILGCVLKESLLLGFSGMGWGRVGYHMW